VGKDQPHNLIDDVIHQRTRLAIMATLAGLEHLDFNDLKAQLGLTDGNLSTHLAALERAEYVEITKSFKGKKPRTTVAQTAKGRKALKNYVNLLQGILDQAK
jgi:DNA-binding MarR family transcriptional regulator|tara:strand:+ start:28 stop:333 length:306 start_codon:yes stop_codon:yes gene_type:complete